MGCWLVRLCGVPAGSREADIRQLLMPDRDRWLITHMKFDPATQRVVIRFWSNAHAAACVKEFKLKGYEIAWAASAGALTAPPRSNYPIRSLPRQRDARTAYSVRIVRLPRATTERSFPRLATEYGAVGNVEVDAEFTIAVVDFENELDGVKWIASLPRYTVYYVKWSDTARRKLQRYPIQVPSFGIPYVNTTNKQQDSWFCKWPAGAVNSMIISGC